MTFRAVGHWMMEVGVAVLIFLCCTACGEGSSEKEAGIDGYVYRPELLFTIEGQ